MRSFSSRVLLGSAVLFAVVVACGGSDGGGADPGPDAGDGSSSGSSSGASSSGSSGTSSGGSSGSSGSSGSMDAGSDGGGDAGGGECTKDTDCKGGGVCSASKKCVAGLSCKGSANGPAGIDTCGKGEPGEPGAVHESCCRSLPLPVTTTRALDKYEITAGRVRAFVDAIAAANGGVPNVRAWAKAYAAAHPASQLADVETSYPGLIDAVLPDHAGPAGATPLPVHLGAFPIDPINSLDGCYTANGAEGHATYWQDPADVGVYGVGDGAGNRKYPRATLDAKSVNCIMPLMLATFCAWDGGELARTSDFHEVWGRRPTTVGTATVYIPWATLLPIGSFDFRNGHGGACSGFLASWPGCVATPPAFYTFPADYVPANDDTPVVGAPGRFPMDVTAITSANGEGWYDVGGNMMDMAWPTNANPGANAVKDFCDTTSAPGPGDTACSRTGSPGVVRYAGDLPHVALVGYSFEGHSRRSEAYLAAVANNEALIPKGDLKPVTFQYGKVGGRCARNVVP